LNIRPARLVVPLGLAVLAFLVIRSPEVREQGRRRAVAQKRERKLAFDAQAQEWDRLRFSDPATGEIPIDAKAGEAALRARMPLSASGGLQLDAAPVWRQRGPFGVGGRTRAVAIDASNEQVMLMASVTGGIWRSTDQGATWSKALRPDQLHNVVSLVQDTRPGYTQHWYAGTGERIGSGHGVGNGIYKSTDGGVSWELLTSTTNRSEFAFVGDLAMDPSNPTQAELYAGTHQGIYRSVNGGATWSLVMRAYGGISVEVGADGVVYAGYAQGAVTPASALLRSTNGTTWTTITPAGWPTLVNELRIAISKSSPQEVHFFTESDNLSRLWKYTYVSGDGRGAGGVWQDRSSQLPWYLGTYNGYCMAVAVKPDDPNGVFVGGQIVTRFSENAGQFHGIGSPAPHPDTHAFAFLPSNPDVVFIATDGGLYRSDNAMFAFRPLNEGYVTTQFYGVGIHHELPGSDALVGGTQDNWSYYAAPSDSARTVFGGSYGSDGGFSKILPDGEHVTVETQGGPVILRNLRTGLEQSANPYEAGLQVLFINPYTFDPAAGWSMYYPLGGYVWRTADVRQPQWEKLEATRLDQWPISAFGFSTAAPAHRLYYGTMMGRVARVDDVNVGSPAAVEITPPGFDGYVSSISVDPDDGARVLVTVSNYNVKSIWWSEDAGASWSEVGGNLDASGGTPGFQGPAVTASAILPRAGGGRRYLVGTSMGLFSTTTLAGAATVWSVEAGESIGNLEVNQIAVRASDGFVAVATHGAGLWSASYGAPVPVAVSAPPPGAGVSLGRAQPSPFLTSTTIPFALAAPARVTLDAFDAAGRRVARLADGTFGAGRHRARWEAAGLAPGVYHVRLRAGGEQRTQRVVLAR
jgi:hypothetical protein